MKTVKTIEVSQKITTRPDTGIFSATLSLEDRRYLKSCLMNQIPVSLSFEGKVFSLKMTNLEVHGGDFTRDKVLPIGICYDKNELVP